MTTPPIDSYLIDMDGVLVHEEQAIPGAAEFIARAARRRAAVPAADEQLDLHAPRPRCAARAAAASTCPRRRSGPPRSRPPASCTSSGPAARAFVIGEAGLTTALHEVGYALDRRDPTTSSSARPAPTASSTITQAIRLIAAGARFIATNPDATGPTPDGLAARDGLRRGPDQPRHRRRALLRRQAEPADDALGAERDRRPLRAHRDGRRPHGHRRRRRHRGGHAHHPRADRRHHRASSRALPVPPVADRRLGRRPDRADRIAGMDDPAPGGPHPNHARRKRDPGARVRDVAARRRRRLRRGRRGPRAGYRHIDTAAAYRNEAGVGRGDRRRRGSPATRSS